jgi:hypothetical protein
VDRGFRDARANDALVDVDTVRYSVPHRLVRTDVEVLVGEGFAAFPNEPGSFTTTLPLFGSCEH